MPPQKYRVAVFCHTILRSAVSVLFAIAWCSLPNTANAEVPHFRVELAVPPELPECNREQDLIGMLLPMLTGPVLEPPTTHVLTLRVSKTQLVYRAELIVKDVNGLTVESTHTEFPASMSCFEVLYRSALRMAVRMNRDVVANASTPPAASCPVCPSLPPCLKEPQNRPRKSTPIPSPNNVGIDRRWFVGAGIAAAYGLAPEMVPSVHFIGGLKLTTPWSIELNAGATFPYEAYAKNSGVIYMYSMGNLNVGPCYKIGPVGACAFAGTSFFTFKTIEVDNSQVDWRGSARLGVRGWMEQQLSERWFLRADLHLASSLARPRIRDEARNERWYMPFLTGGMSATVAARF